MKNVKFINSFYILGLVILFASETVSAQQGGQIFKDAACNLLSQVLTKDFGAMLTVLAGLFALISSVVGAFRMAWVLVFVSVGVFIFPKFVYVLFPDLNCPVGDQ